MVTINARQIKRVAELLKKLPEGRGLNFYSYVSGENEIVASDMYPPLHHPEAINFFFFVCLHQHGFWYGDERGYLKPLVGRINGKECKGSDLLWKAAKKAFDNCNDIFDPKRLASIEPEELFGKIFMDDRGPIPFPDIEERLKLTRRYGRYFSAKDKLLPNQTVELVSGDVERPLQSFYGIMKCVSGYDTDRFQKKTSLLAMVLANRPEKFLKATDSQNWRPIIDYHVMRVALRLGIIDLGNQDLKMNNEARAWVDSEMEHFIRSAVYDAVWHLIYLSARGMPFIDEKLWNARRYCPEMSTPDCPKCLFAAVCKKRTKLFQPVFRTVNY